MMDIWDFVDCGGCLRYGQVNGRVGGDPSRCYPVKEKCFDGDFGNEYPCERMLSRIEEGLRDGDFMSADFELVESEYMLSPGNRSDYSNEFAAWPAIDWGSRPYWQLFYDEREPIGFDSALEVYDKVFR
jgi:hypothetical protein